MEPQRSPFRLLLLPPLIAMGLAAALAYWFTDGEEPATPAAPPEPTIARRVEPAEPRPAPPTPAPAAKIAPPPIQAPVEPPAVAAPTPPAPRPDASDDDQFKDPATQEHARSMFRESMKLALKMRNLEHLNQLRTAMQDPRLQSVLPPADVAAFDVGMACVMQTTDARSRMTEFLDENPGSPLTESLQGACQF